MIRSLPMIVLAFLMVAADEPPVGFRAAVAPILVKKCQGCHNAKKAEGGLDMSTFATLRRGGAKGGDLILEPGAPDDSLLVELVRPGAAPRMPYKQPPLSAPEIQTLETWVRQGARFDGPSEAETPLASLVDPLRDLPKITLKAPALDPVTALAFAPDGKTLAAAVGRQVILFEAATGKPAATLGDHPGPLAAVRFSPDGKTLIAAGGRAGMFGTLTVWAVETKTRRLDLRGHGDAILAAEFAPDGKTIATGSFDRLVILWDLATGKVVRTLKDHTDAVYAVAFTPDGQTLASASGDRTVKVWDVAAGRKRRTFSDADAELYALAIAPDGASVLAAGVDRSIHRWRLDEPGESRVKSVFAHDGPVLRLAMSRDGKTLVSSGEDRAVKVWDLATLEPRATLSAQPDWPQGLALRPDGARLAVGRYDGSLAVYETATGKVALTLKTAPEASPPAKPALVRNATLNPPNPRGARRGSALRLTLTGNGVGQATQLLFTEPRLSATIEPAAKPDANRLDVALAVEADARPGVHRIGVVTPLGVPAFQTFAVSAYPEAAETEPNDEPAALKAIPLPATLLGAIEKPGDVDQFRIEGKAGQILVFEVVAKALGSALLPDLSLNDDRGRVVAGLAGPEAGTDPVLTATLPRDGTYLLRVADADYNGSANHFYRISAGELPAIASVFPLGVGRGTTTIRVEGANLPSDSVALTVPDDSAPGTLREVPVEGRAGARPGRGRSVVVAEGPQAIESEPNDDPKQAGPSAAPGGVSGRIGHDGDSDLFRFEAKKGERRIVEVFGGRLGTAIDPVVEILDDRGRPLPRAVLRPVDQTEVAFRDHDSSKPGIRLTRWPNLAMNDLVLIGREVAKVLALPRNPDDDCLFWSEKNQRLGFLETTPEQHPMGQPIYKIEVHPPGTTFPTGGVPPVTLTYRNDDGGPGLSKDARLTFDPPADGTYLVRVEDVRGLGGAGFGYHLVVRPPRPDFRLALSPENPNVARGGTTLVTASIERIDGFEGAVEVTVEGLPSGVTATPARIERAAFTASLALTADASAPAFSPPTWRVRGRAAGPSSGTLTHEVDPGGPVTGLITVTPAPPLQIVARPTRLAIRPGARVALDLAVVRGPAFAGRVPIEVRNLPQGVRVLNIGLNGVLVTEAQSERSVFLYAEPWAEPGTRPFYAVGKAEATATEHSSMPIELVVEPVGATVAEQPR